MNISWLGHSCFKIEDKIDNQAVAVVTDPYDNSIGLRLPKTKADLVLVSHNEEDRNNVDGILPAENGDLIVIERPGEYEARKVFVQGIGCYRDKKEGAELGKSVIYKINLSGVNILHLGGLGTQLSDSQLELIEDVDILLLPIGGANSLDAKSAAAIVRKVEPRIVIPMQYNLPGLKLKLDDLDKFKKEMGGSIETLPKLKVSKKDLPVEQIKVIVLDKA